MSDEPDEWPEAAFKMVNELSFIVWQLERFGRARDRRIERDVRTAVITDDQAVTILEALGASQPAEGRMTCKVIGCDRPPAREVPGRVLLCKEHANEYEDHAEHDWR